MPSNGGGDLVPIKVGICVAYDWQYLQYCLPSLYADADKICVSIDKRRLSFSGTPYTFDERNFRELISAIDVDKKVIILEENFYDPTLTPGENESKQRAAMERELGRGGWHLQIDCDEYFQDFRRFVRILKRASAGKNGKVISVLCPLVVLFKRMDDGFLVVDPEVKLKLEYMCFAKIGDDPGPGRVAAGIRLFTNEKVLHQSWARTEEEVVQKIDNWGHTDHLDKESYLKRWLSITNDNYSQVRGVHPLRPDVWPRLRYVKAVSGIDPALLLQLAFFPEYSKLELMFVNSAFGARFLPFFVSMKYRLFRWTLRIKKKVSCAASDAGSLFGTKDRFFKDARGSIILVYHGICQEDPGRFNDLFLTRETFVKHLEFYHRYFNVASLDDYFAGNLSADRFNVCITFDDGYENNYKYVLPLLEERKTPAAFFITAIRKAGYDILWNSFLDVITKYGPRRLLYQEEFFRRHRSKGYVSVREGFRLVDKIRNGGFGMKKEMMDALSYLNISGNEPGNSDFLSVMTDEQIREMAQSPWVTIGAHGYFHNDLSMITANEAKWEMQQSKQYLEELISREVRAMAFPYGAYIPATKKAAQECGFTQLLPLAFRWPQDASDPVMRDRFPVASHLSIYNQMVAIVKRSHYWY